MGGTVPAFAGGHSVRSEIMKIPGVGMGSPGDAEWQKVGALCMGPVKERVSEGEFKGVELTFMGLNNQNLHNFLFRGFLKPWEEYTGAKINWIDLAQADYNPRLQQSIATKTVDFDIIEMGAPFEGDTAGQGLLNEMPDWVKDQIDYDDLVGYLQPPVGTWDGKAYRINIDGDCHTFCYRKDYFGAGSITGRMNPPNTWQEVNQISKDVAGKTDPLTGLPAHGFLDPLKGWGGFGMYFLTDRAGPYVKHPDDPAFLFDIDTMKPRVNNPGWVQAIQDVMDLIATKGAYPADQINADPGTTGFQQFLAGTGSMLTWWGDIGSNARTSDTSVIGDVVGFSAIPGSDRVYNHKKGAWENKYNEAPNNAYLGWGVYVTNRVEGDSKKRKAAWSAAAHLGGKDLSLWTSAYPSGFQPYRNSHFNYDEWESAGYDRAFVEDYLGSNLDT
jgi:multiple sugar transport system substrate-binding protein